MQSSVRGCPRSGIYLAMLSALGTLDAVAQQTQGSATLEEIVVTATGTNISGVAPVGSETVSLGREEMIALGADNLAEVVRSLPQIQNLGFDESARAGGGNPTRGTSVNLRGIGQNATLVLVDGHRLTPAGTAASFTEAIQLPMAAVERVEVIADGASAVYGSDAISGVVNYVLRKEFDGVEVGARYATNDYGDDWSATVLAGTSWDGFGPLGRGSVIVSYERFEQDPILRSALPWYRQDLRQFGGLDGRVWEFTATPATTANIRVPMSPGSRNPVIPVAGAYTLYGLPVGTNGQGLTVANLRTNDPNIKDRSEYEDFLPETTRDHVTLFLNQRITEWLSAYYQGFYTDRDSFSRVYITQNPQTVTFTVPAMLNQPNGTQVPNPNYITGIPGVAPGAPLTVQYNLADHLPAGVVQGTSNVEETFSHTAGLRAELFGDWNADFYFTYGTVENCGVCYFGSQVNFGPTDGMQRAINEGFINPLSSERLTQAQWDAIRGDNIQRTQNRLVDTVLKFDGPLFDLPAGAVRMAVGGEYTEHHNKLQNGSIRAPSFLGLTAQYGQRDTFMWDANTDESRYQHAVFAEVYVPVVASDQSVPLVNSLNVSAAVRYDSFSDVGDTTNPKLGFTWELTDQFSLRGSWGRSFRAPGLPEGNNGLFSATLLQAFFPNNSGDPNIRTVAPGLSSVVLRVGGNPEVRPERGKTWSFGFDWEPDFLEGFTIAGTYYTVEYDDRIGGLAAGTMLANPANRLIYSNFIIPTPAVPGCVASDRSTWHPAVRDAYENPQIPGFNRSFLYGNDTFIANNPCNAAAVLDARNTNAASTTQNGIDLQLGYSFGAFDSSWNVGLYASKILKNEQVLIEGLPTEEIMDRISYPTSMRARGNINWGRNGWSAALFANFVGDYKNDQTITVAGVTQPVTQVPSWTTFDLNLGYMVPEGAGAFLDGVRINANVRNVSDRDPPVVLFGTGQTPHTAQDGRNHSPLGRTFQFSLTKSF